jgi:hypothetical protein
MGDMNPFNIFRKSKIFNETHPQVHMTLASSHIRSGVTRTGVFLKKRLWLWPIIAVVLLSVVGFSVRSAIESTMKRNLTSTFEMELSLVTGMLENWYAGHKSNSESMANDVTLRQKIYQLLEFNDATQDSQGQPLDAVQLQLQKNLLPALESHDYVGYFVADKSQRIFSSSHTVLDGQEEIPEYKDFLAQTLDGETVVCPPFASVIMMKNRSGELRMREPTMFVCTPIRNESFQVIAALALQIQPDREFTRILQLGRIGESGETYAFDKNGRMVSNSRFDEDLILKGLLPDHENSRSILNVLVRDPQGEVTAGYRPKFRRAELPLTRMAADAITGNSDVDVEGYRDYRGVPVVGAWAWMTVCPNRSAVQGIEFKVKQ